MWLHQIRLVYLPLQLFARKYWFSLFFTKTSPMDGRTDWPTDRPTDIPGYRDARMHLKKCLRMFISFFFDSRCFLGRIIWRSCCIVYRVLLLLVVSWTSSWRNDETCPGADGRCYSSQPAYLSKWASIRPSLTLLHNKVQVSFYMNRHVKNIKLRLAENLIIS